VYLALGCNILIFWLRHNAECQYAEHFAILIVVMSTGIILNMFILSAIMLSAVMPNCVVLSSVMSIIILSVVLLNVVVQDHYFQAILLGVVI
jgi:hypothetical protein